jgi:uncharacterized protein YukE
MPPPATPDFSKVDPVTLRSVAEEVDETAELIRGLGLQIDQHRSDLMFGWSSIAGAKFSNLITQWLGDLEAIRGQLNEMHFRMVGTAVTYESDEQERLDAINAMASSIQSQINY